MLYWAFRDIHFGQIFSNLARLSLHQIGALLLVNVTFNIILTVRWWVILRGLGTSVSIWSLVACRLAGFSVSYLTPGPLFGGEPVQVLLAQKVNGTPLDLGSASVILDKTFELLGNFAFLGLAAFTILSQDLLGSKQMAVTLLFCSILILLPLLYLGFLFRGNRPLVGIVKNLPNWVRRRSWHGKLLKFLEETETRIVHYCRRKAYTLGQILLFFLLVWTVAVFEMWLALSFLGIRLTLPETIFVLAGGKLALLLPFPGALGILEVTQIFIFGLFSRNAETAVSLTMYIRFRDLLFVAAGLAITLFGYRKR